VVENFAQSALVSERLRQRYPFLRAAWGVPMMSGQTVVGVLCAAYFTPQEATAEKLRLLQLLGDEAALAVERARLTAELQRSNQELQQFAYVVAHDLQEPLRMVATYVQLLAKRSQGRLDAETQEFMSYAVDGAERMQALIQDLLAYTRVDGAAPQWTPVDSEALLGRTLGNLHFALEDMRAEVTHDPLPTVQGDAKQLGLVLQNLVGNALKFHGEAPPRIHIAARRDGQHWVFAVRDNGIGIDPKHTERIFGVFQRLHTRREYPGTGIGLAICKKIIERHGGRIWVESEPGRGATFFFTLPMP
jgi:light-regulated signal transduction histidine kinase (bacteriophytochrome)